MRRLHGGAFLCVLGLTTTAAVMIATFGLGAGASNPRLHAYEPKAVAKADTALDRTREEVKMLDELYKNAVVSITKRYDGPPAIKVAQDVFAAMEKSGRHKAKLVDATGAPQNEANLPKTDFEKRAVEEIKKGKPYYEEVSGLGEKRTLFAATIVPAVHKKCAVCHGVKEGDLLGFIRYEVPVK
ncbi:MAG: hypothetical protein NVSMB14_04660 [Isosphaeraceae bacterium]